jgi:HD superfamily phosphohydrolase
MQGLAVVYLVIYDEHYGEYEIEDVLIELLHTKPVQRLKKVHQAGAAYLVNNEWNTTRYEHSIGTMLLVKKLGGTVEEQIASLLHDISHTAFSHVVDFVFNLS